MYEVIGNNRNRTFRVIWMLEEIGVPYYHLPCAAGSEEARSISPTGKLPAMRIDGEVIADSGAILTFLADKHGKLTAPAGTVERAQQDAMTYRVLDEMDALLWTAARHSFILPEDRRVPEVKDSLKWEFDRNLSRIADAMEGPFLMGDEMTVSDIFMTHCLGWAITAKFPIERQEVRDYFDRMKVRPAYVKARAVE